MVLGSTSLPSKPLISTRRGIAWGLAPRSEDSSVLVLTSPQRYYVDIRFALDGEPTAAPFWAFAGQVTYTQLPGLGDEEPVGIRGEWNHPIDSMGNTEGVDRADLFLLDNGDQIEVGLLENPETGKEDRFMEYWTRPKSSNAKASTTENGETGDSRCTVAILEEGDKTIGIAIRVGNYAQGIQQSAESACGVLVTRYSKESGESGDWKKDPMNNDQEDKIPLQWLLQDRKVGDTKSGGAAWRVVETEN